MIIELRQYNSAADPKAAVCMREMGDGARDTTPGHIQPASDPGIREDMDPLVLEPERGISKYM